MMTIRNGTKSKKRTEFKNGPETGIGMRKIVVFLYKIECGAALKGSHSYFKSREGQPPRPTVGGGITG